MKNAFFVIAIVWCCSFVISGCIKHPVNLTINPVMTAAIGTTASVGTSTFTAVTVTPAVVTSQVNDTTDKLIITGNANLYQNSPGDQIILTITKYKNATGTFSLVQGQAIENYVHNNVVHVGSGGIISITNITPNSIIGYFSFTTVDGYSVTNGSFNVGKPL